MQEIKQKQKQKKDVKDVVEEKVNEIQLIGEKEQMSESIVFERIDDVRKNIKVVLEGLQDVFEDFRNLVLKNSPEQSQQYFLYNNQFQLMMLLLIDQVKVKTKKLTDQEKLQKEKKKDEKEQQKKLKGFCEKCQKEKILC